MDLFFHPSVEKAAQESILVTGVGRSGTTIVGKLISSCANVEYFFEPESLIGLYAVARSIPDSVYKTLYTSLLVEDLGLNSIAGRNLNRNCNDDSAIDLVKDTSDLQARLAKSWRRLELLDSLPSYRFAFKIPSIVPEIPLHMKLFPQSRIVIVIRNPVSVYRSIQQKGWFNDSAPPLHSPFVKCSEQSSQTFIPYWVAEDFRDTWSSSSELGKFVHYYSHIYNAAISLQSSEAVYIDYDKLIADPLGLTHKLFRLLGLDPGAKTPSVLKTISPRQPSLGGERLGPETEALEALYSIYSALLPLSL